MEAPELGLAIAHQQRRRKRFDAATEKPQHVERRVVSPMHVLEHQDRRRTRLQLSHQRRGDLERPRARLDELLELAAGGRGDVDERPERPRREQSVARAPEEPGAGRRVVAEAPQQRGLADAGLPADEHQPPTRALPHRLDALAEDRELLDRARAAPSTGRRSAKPLREP